VKLYGEFALIKLKKDPSGNAWLLVKKRDAFSTIKRTEIPANDSVKTGRSLEEIAAESEEKGDVWLSKRKTHEQPKAPQKNRQSGSAGRSDPMPRKIKPMLAVASRGDLKGKEWIFEPALDGLRAIAEVEQRKVTFYSKSGLAFERKFPEIVNELKTTKNSMVLDGDVVKGPGTATYHVFDLLYLNGRDLRKEPLTLRKKLLRELDLNGHCVRTVREFRNPPQQGFVAKASRSVYRGGISTEWQRFDGSKGATKDSVEEPRFTHLDKVYFPKDGITKGDVIRYYESIAPFMLPYLVDRPHSLNRQPNGIGAPGFYQKDMTGFLPKWLKTERIFSESADKSVNYLVCTDVRSLLYMVNLGCIEIHPWFSRVGHLDEPDYLVIDLDPDGNDFRHVIEIAHEVHDILEEVGAPSFCKTSGATGIHIAVPTGAKYAYEDVRKFAEAVCRIIAKRHPATTSVDRNPQRRRKKIYMDFLQNRRGQTLAAPLCIRPHPGAPVSMPLQWKDLTSKVRPDQFHMKNALQHIRKHGDCWKNVLGQPVQLDKAMKALGRKFLKEIGD
jgi:DNA ligase D-like protein (predicted polymerase)